MSRSLQIRPMTLADAPAAARLLAEARPEYIQHFHPFPFTGESLAAQLGAVREDRWWALVAGDELAGLFFLRGFDEGYRRPAFGVFVAESASGQGGGRAALRHALAWCAGAGVEKVLLKVHPENLRARHVYLSEGFQPAGLCERSGQEMMEWTAPSANPQPA